MTQLQNQFAQSPEKGQIDLQFGGSVLPVQVKTAEAAPLVPGQAVKMVDSAGGVPKVTAVAADTDENLGIVVYNRRQSSFDAEEAMEIASVGSVVRMEASAAIARGAKVMVLVAGSKVLTATTGKSIIGYAYDKSSGGGDLIRVMLLQPSVAP